MARSITTAVRWSLDYIARKSWLRRALIVLALLVTLDIVINSWQSWHDLRAADALAAQRLDAQASLVTARIPDRLEGVSVSMAQIEKMLESRTLADVELTQLAQAMRPAHPSGLISLRMMNCIMAFISSSVPMMV